MAEETGSTASSTGTANEHVSGVPAEVGPEEAPGITLVGIVFETAAGLRRALAPGIESELSVGGLAFEVLVRLVRSPDARLRMTDLAAQTGLTPGGLTRAIDRLAAAGFVCREACSGDRRGAYATLTPSGRARIAAVLQRHERDIETLTAGVFDESDSETLVTLLRRLRDRVHPQAARVTTDPEEPGSALPR